MRKYLSTPKELVEELVEELVDLSNSKELVDKKSNKLWKKRLEKGKYGCPEDDWTEAEEYFKKHWWEVLWWKFIKSRKLPLVVVFGLIISILFLLVKLPSWTEFSQNIITEETRQQNNKKGQFTENIIKYHQPEKRFLDWSNLIVRFTIPCLLSFLGWQFQKIDKKKAEDNLSEEAIINYLDSIAKLLLDKELQKELYSDFKIILNKKSRKSFAHAKITSFDNEDNDNHVHDVARIRTITILRRLEGDKKRQALIIRFLRDAELYDFIFRNANLSIINLKEAALKGANFQKANLGNAILNKAALEEADFQATNLANANLAQANLAGANLAGAVLFATNLQETNLEGAQLGGTQLGGANLKQAILHKAKLEGAQLGGANLKQAVLRNAKLNPKPNAKLEEVTVLKKANLQQAILAGANLAGANLAGANLQQAVLVETRNRTSKQIKSARFWEKAIYKGDWNDEKKAWEPTSDNTKFIEYLKKGVTEFRYD